MTWTAVFRCAASLLRSTSPNRRDATGGATISTLREGNLYVGSVSCFRNGRSIFGRVSHNRVVQTRITNWVPTHGSLLKHDISELLVIPCCEWGSRGAAFNSQCRLEHLLSRPANWLVSVVVSVRADKVRHRGEGRPADCASCQSGKRHRVGFPIPY